MANNRLLGDASAKEAENKSMLPEDLLLAAHVKLL
jgi:hypothetical protein